MYFYQKILILLFFVLGLITVFGFRIWQVKNLSKRKFIPEESLFKLKPPKDVLIGRIVEREGEVKRQARDEEEFMEAQEDELILPGEKLATFQKSKTVAEFAGFLKVSLNPNSEISFVSLLPGSFVIRQARGGVGYELLQDKNPISIRSLNMLLMLEKGVVNLVSDRDNNEIIVELKEGRAKIGMKDKENETNVWGLEKGQKAIVNDLERSVEID